ncbi:MAG: DUF2283 domain-containing protein [Chloroherpetonaceae bacterium]|nr:DUF2283 domain-containing protein [Chloroherpetonaceae bacterium]
MKKLKVIHDKEGNTLTVWFGDPAVEYSCDETDDDTILMKDKEGHIIGIEKLNYYTDSENVSITLESFPS